MDASLRNRKRPSEGRSSCLHEDCGHRERLYSPPFDRRITRVPVQRFPYCLNCGKLKNVSSDKAKMAGWFTNLLRVVNHNIALSHGKITQAQQRLIISDIERVADFEDRYHMTRSAQLDLFFVAIHRQRPDIPFWVLERAATPEPPRKADPVKALPAWVQYLEWLKKKRARDAAAAAPK
ncbi:MAG: hypothetical protein FJ149_12880 [Euryarchaeota archaeon]|nr:hypothetical protein [Euryarchaeota archaeon]